MWRGGIPIKCESPTTAVIVVKVRLNNSTAQSVVVTAPLERTKLPQHTKESISLKDTYESLFLFVMYFFLRSSLVAETEDTVFLCIFSESFDGSLKCVSVKYRLVLLLEKP